MEQLFTVRNNLRTLLAAIFLFSGIQLAQAEIKTDGGVYLRLRHELWVNPFDQNSAVKDNRNFFRIKASLFGSLSAEDFGVAKEAKLFIKLTDEFKSYSDYYYRGKQDTTFDINEMVIDNLYVDLKGFLNDNLDLRIGRQNFLGTYGEGFLIMDGTPLDGSRTFYFNAAKASWKINDENTLDLIYLYDPKTDNILPAINNNNRNTALNFTDEQGWVAYLKNKSIEGLNFEPYYIYKYASSGSTKLSAENSKLNTFGAYAKYKLTDSVTLRGQAAFQFGEYGDNDRAAFGGYAFVDKAFADIKTKPVASFGYYYLSGDDPSTDKMEAWDPLFSKWPWISEYYALSYAAESGIGYWTNLQALAAKVKLTTSEKSKLSLNYYYLRANENPTDSIFGDGNERGHLPQIRFDYKINKNISTYALVEYFIPGDFYKPDNRDPGLFSRVEVSFKF